MALENIMRVDKGNIIGGSGSGASNNFQGTIEEWNALSTAEKKAYDHASIPDSLDGNVTFPASKVMLNSGDSVEDAIGDVIKYEVPISNLAVETAWGNVFTAEKNVDISSLGLSNAPTVLSALYDVLANSATQPVAWIVVGYISATSLKLNFLRGTVTASDGKLNGKVILMLKSNG